MKLLENFKLNEEKEDFKMVYDTIEKGVVFKGTNLWVLIFAIFMASLGLNVNSTAVIIGAMLISPLMGPIMGLGFGMGIQDKGLLKKALRNYLFAAGVSLITSTIYFLGTPVTGAQSELLARTSPTIYDVMIALLGGLAGMFATSSKQKGNVLPGVAIATALMPPLCTAGYGLANLKPDFFFGAFYLFFINTVFIALATFITVRILKFPLKIIKEKKEETMANRIFLIVVIITLLPSIYFGYDLVKRNNFLKKANQFITMEAIFPNNYLLKKTIDAKNEKIILIYGGQFIEETKIEAVKNNLTKYQLDTTALIIKQGFGYLGLKDEKNEGQANQIIIELNEKEKQLKIIKNQLDSMNAQNELGDQVYNELKIQYPFVQSCMLQQATKHTDSSQSTVHILSITSGKVLNKTAKNNIEEWLKIKLKTNDVIVYFLHQ